MTRKVLILCCCVAVAGCAAPAKKLSHISLGMKKVQVVEELGQPRVHRGSVRNKFEQVVEVWEYRFALPHDEDVGTILGKSAMTVVTFGMGAASFSGERKDYWLYFVEDELVQWGESGDWFKEAERIYEVDFNPSPRLRQN